MTLSPRVGALLTRVTETPDLETALLKVLSEYIELKVELLRGRIGTFESKWKMTFDEFSERMEAGTLDQDAYEYAVESDFWEWEKAVTLLEHYEGCIRRGRLTGGGDRLAGEYGARPGRAGRDVDSRPAEV